MIEKLIEEEDGEFIFPDNGVSYSSKSEFLEIEILGFCGCGAPHTALEFLRDILKLIDAGKGYGDEIKKLLPNDGVYFFVFYMLSDKKLTEHGSSIGGCWLSDKGKELLADIEWCIENERELEEG